MPDFVMCNNDTCPSRFACYRYTAIHALDQSYAWFEPTVRWGYRCCCHFMTRDNLVATIEDARRAHDGHQETA